ncbi:hypothetical protein ACFEMC_20130 [Kineococcus sp. DHX-1]|uniref:TolB family protein n=1 Tax=Kineococcus sp. DHX-1 TaxID=3349638 RepID=UPI0036D21255
MSSRRLPLLVALCVLVLGTLAVLAVAALPGQRRPPSRSVVPAQFPGYSALTAPVATNPVGAALAVYRQDAAGGVTGTTQTLVLGADGASARRLIQATDRGSSQAPAAAVVSPDGRTVALGDGPAGTDPARATAPDPASPTLPPGRVVVTPSPPAVNGGAVVTRPVGASSTLALVDLSSGDTRVHVVPRVPVVVPVSWSADGARLAYLGTDLPAASEAGAPSTGHASGQLFVLDTRSDRAVAVPGAERVVAAAFSPDGARLAYQEPGAAVVHVVDPFAGDSTEPGTELVVPQGAVLADGPAWSPDGTLLAVEAGSGTPSARIEFVAAQPGRGVPTAVPGRDVLGWTGPGELVHQPAPSGGGDGGDLTVVRTDLRTGATSPYLRVPTARGHHPAGDLTLAGALLTRAVATTSTSVDRGPWPLPVRLGLVLAAAALAAPATAGLLRRREQLAALTAVPDWARDTTRG